MSTIQVNIVSAEKELYSGQVNMVVVPGMQGELGIYHQHTPLLTGIKPGEVRIKIDGEEDQSIFVAGGYIEVQPNLVTVLADTALRAEDADLELAEKAKQAAQLAIDEHHKDNYTAEELTKLHDNLITASAQLDFVRKIHKR